MEELTLYREDLDSFGGSSSAKDGKNRWNFLLYLFIPRVVFFFSEWNSRIYCSRFSSFASTSYGGLRIRKCASLRFLPFVVRLFPLSLSLTYNYSVSFFFFLISSSLLLLFFIVLFQGHWKRKWRNEFANSHRYWKWWSVGSLRVMSNYCVWGGFAWCVRLSWRNERRKLRSLVLQLERVRYNSIVKSICDKVIEIVLL